MDFPYLKSCLIGLFMIGVCAAAHPNEVVIASDLEVDSQVEGDVLVIGGSLLLGPNAHVTGDAVTIFGTVELMPGAKVEGHVLHMENLASLGPDLSEEKHGRVTVFLLSSGFWLLLTTLGGLLFRPALARGLFTVRSVGWRVVLFAFLIQLILIGALIGVLGFGPRSAGVLTALILALALGIKIMGLSVIGWWLGAGLVPPRLGSAVPVTGRIFLGVSLMMVLRVIPVLGGFVWMVVSFMALGVGVFVLGSLRGKNAPVTV